MRIRAYNAVVVTLLVAAARARAQDAACSAAATQPAVLALTKALDAVSAVGPVWGNYTLANHPLILLDQPPDTTKPVCAVIWRYRDSSQIVTLRGRIRKSTPLYAMWDGDSVGRSPTANGRMMERVLSPIPPELERTMRARGFTRAIILTAPIRFEELGNLGKALVAMHADPLIIATQLAVHESYHLHSQIAVWLDQAHQYAWPRWDVQPDRRALNERCYAAPAVADAHKQELAALLATWDLVSDSTHPRDAHAVRQAAQHYVTLRLKRYAMLDTTTVPSPSGPMPCAMAEDMMELEEGAPQWMAYDTAVRAGIMKPEQAGRAANDAFYVSGTFQLWTLQRLLGRDEMRKLTNRITAARDYHDPEASIFRVFARRVAGTDVR